MSVTDQFREFVKDVRLESAKVSWPTREELRDSTVVVVTTVLLVAAFIGVVDRLLTFAVGLLFQ
ncbi:MAG: preprotein translocase subunit SecE [Candidatus Eisenbacteria bacterium]|jgi:preprotein translocase subunit SecE|nr:preprotein translocase subunit SecE [Candidatus Eisenbacteria bacterium]